MSICTENEPLLTLKIPLCIRTDDEALAAEVEVQAGAGFHEFELFVHAFFCVYYFVAVGRGSPCLAAEGLRGAGGDAGAAFATARFEHRRRAVERRVGEQRRYADGGAVSRRDEQAVAPYPAEARADGRGFVWQRGAVVRRLFYRVGRHRFGGVSACAEVFRA